MAKSVHKKVLRNILRSMITHKQGVKFNDKNSGSSWWVNKGVSTIEATKTAAPVIIARTCIEVCQMAGFGTNNKTSTIGWFCYARTCT